MSEVRETAAEGVEATAIAGVLDRPRLDRVLEAELVRVCVLQGPSGCGKTTLLRSWALRQPRQAQVVWVSLSDGVSSRQAFWGHVASSATRLGELPEVVAQQVRDQLSIAADPVRIAASILEGAGDVVLVLDAYEHLGDVMAEIDRDLADLLSVTPHLRIILTTRASTRLADIDLPGNGFARVVTLAELAFTAEEVGAFIRAQAGFDDPRLATSIASATHGFALTVRAVVLTLSQLGTIPRIDSAEWNAILAAKLESLLPDAVTVQFVTDTSVPPYVDGELARLLSGIEDPGCLLDMLERNGFGRWIPYAHNRQVFQYVETIRDTFRARAAADAERFRSSCVTTAGWLLENEEVVEQALQFAIEGGDLALADRAFVAVVIGNPDSYISDRFLATLRQVPEAALRDHPMLAFGLALALGSNPIVRLQCPLIARIAYESTSTPTYLEPSVDRFFLASMRAISRRLALHFRDSAEASLEAVRTMDAIPPEVSMHLGEHLGTVLRQLSYSIFQGGRTVEAIQTIDRSVALCPTPKTRNFSAVYSACYAAVCGDVARASALAALIDTAAWPAELRQSYMNAPGLIAEGYARLDSFDFDRAASIPRDATSYIQTAEFWPFVMGIAVVARHALGQARAEADRMTRELTAAGPPPGVGDNLATEHLHAVVALAWLAGGDHRMATRMLADQPEESPHIAQARIAVLLADGRDQEALRLARTLLEVPGHTIRTLAATRTVAAVAALRQGEHDLAWSWLTAAALAWETYGPRMHVVQLHPRDRRLLWELATQRGADSLLRYLDVPTSVARASGAAAAVPTTLTKRELVVLTALAEHEAIRSIAEHLVVSPHTIKTQLQSIYRKLGVSSREAAITVARESGLLGSA